MTFELDSLGNIEIQCKECTEGNNALVACEQNALTREKKNLYFVSRRREN